MRVLLMAETFCSISYLIASMGLQVLWSFGLMCLDIHALRFNKDLHTNIIVSLFVVGDWVSETLLRFITFNCFYFHMFTSRDRQITMLVSPIAC